MSLQVIEARVRGFICLNAHPVGCRAEVAGQVAAARLPGATPVGGKLLVVGASTGYGLASRIAGAFGHGMDTVGVSFERPAKGRRTASAGWYNTAAFEELAAGEGLHASDLIGDAFSDEVMSAALDHVARTLGKVDRFVYSIAAPRRTDPATGITHTSVLKTVGRPFSVKTVDLRTEEVGMATIEPATDEEIAATVAVMGGADLERWTGALLEAGLLAPGARVVAFSYIGPEVTWPIYKDGTIGQAKADLQRGAHALDRRLAEAVGGGCNVSVNKSVVTQASAAIPGVPLYMSLLFAVMKARGIHEGPIEQATRLFADHFAPGRLPTTDEEGRIRLDDLEMRPAVQAEALERWGQVTTDNLRSTADWEGFTRYFRRLFGFDVPGVDYAAPVETDVALPNLLDLPA